MSSAESGPLVRVEGLSVAYRSGGADVTVAREVSFEAAAGQTVAVVGESGSGKSTVAGALLGHLRHGSRVTGGRVVVDGRDVLSLDQRGLRELRTRDIAMVGQNAGHALTPSMRVGTQIEESLLGQGLTRARRRERVRSLVEKVGLPDPEGVVRRYPHQLSGGQQQRVAIARALMQDPKLILADEPVASLDPRLAGSVLGLLSDLARERGVPVLVSLHVVALARHYSDRTVGLRDGRVVADLASTDLGPDTVREIYGADTEFGTEAAPAGPEEDA